MIPALMLIAQLPTIPDFAEYPSPNREATSIEAIVKLPELNPAQRFVLAQAMVLAVQMTPEYGNQDVLRVLKTGTRFRLYQGADHIRIGLTVDSNDMGAGLNLLYGVLTQPSFLADKIKARRSNVSMPWSTAYSGFELQDAEFDRETIVSLWQGIMRPKSISVAVSGTFRTGEPTQIWQKKRSAWIQNVPSQLPLAYPLIAKRVPAKPPILIFESKPIAISKKVLASYLLAANAFGVGKESIQWLVAREELNFSYRQESFLLPTLGGWRFRMAFATDANGVQAQSVATLRQKLMARSEAVTQADLDHAIGLGAGYLSNQMPNLPMILGIGETLTNDANDQLYLQHYWKTMFAFDWNPSGILADMKEIKLYEFKKLLVQLLSEAETKVY